MDAYKSFQPEKLARHNVHRSHAKMQSLSYFQIEKSECFEMKLTKTNY